MCVICCATLAFCYDPFGEALLCGFIQVRNCPEHLGEANGYVIDGFWKGTDVIDRPCPSMDIVLPFRTED